MKRLLLEPWHVVAGHAPACALCATFFISASGCHDAGPVNEAEANRATAQQTEVTEEMMHEGLDAVLRLLREMDRTYRGREQVITLQLFDDHSLQDDRGNGIQLSEQQQWEAMLAWVRKHHRSGGTDAYLQAAPAAYYNDGHGELPRAYYRFTVEEPYRLILHVSQHRPQ